MEFDRRRTKWSHVILYVVYAAGAVYLLMSNNKYLYSHVGLKEALVGSQLDAVTPVPKGPDSAEGFEPTSWMRGNPERTGHDISGATRDKDFLIAWAKPVLTRAGDDQLTFWAFDATGFYLSGQHPWAIAVNLDGDIRWRFRFAKRGAERGQFAPVVDQQRVYLSNPDGQVAVLDKVSGRLIWKLNLANEISTSPILVENELWVLVKPLETEARRLESAQAAAASSKSSKRPVANPAQHRLARVNASSGRLIDYSAAMQINGAANLTLARDLKQILITSDNRLHSVSLEDKIQVNTQTLPDAIVGPAVVGEDRVLVALASGKIQAWDMSKKPKFEWEVDLDSPPIAPPLFVPLYSRWALLTKDGNLHMMDPKKAELQWRLPLHNRNPLQDLWATRLSSKYIEKLSMRWEKKGWTLWSPCGDQRLCIYNPDKGQLLSRIQVPGSVVSTPIFQGKSLFLLIVSGKGEERTYSLAHLIDEDTFKGKAKRAEETAGSPSKSSSSTASPAAAQGG